MPRSIHRPHDHYILIPSWLHKYLDTAYHFAKFDPCPYPRPPDFDGLKIPWPDRTFINPPFTSDYGSKTAFIRKAIEENKLGKTIFGIISSTGGHVINMLLAAGAELMPIGRNGRVSWIGVKTGKPMPSPVPTLFFILRGKARDRRPGRPPIGHRAMTSAERQARRRALLRCHETRVSRHGLGFRDTELRAPKAARLPDSFLSAATLLRQASKAQGLVNGYRNGLGLLLKPLAAAEIVRLEIAEAAD